MLLDGPTEIRAGTAYREECAEAKGRASRRQPHRPLASGLDREQAAAPSPCARPAGPDVLPYWAATRYNAREMPFTVKDFQGLLRLLERQPQWKDALRASLLGEEFLELPSLVRSLVQAQRATQRELRALAEAHRQSQQELQALAEAQARTDQTVQDLARQVQALTEAQARTDQQLRALAEAQARTDETVQDLARQVQALTEAQARTDQTVQDLARQVQALTEAQARTEQQLQALTEAQARTDQVVRTLVEAQARTDQRVASLEEAVARLTEAQARTDQTVQDLARQVQALTEAQARTEQQLQVLTEAQKHTEQVVRELVKTVGALKGENLERRYRERAASYFQRVLRRIRVLDHQQLGLLLDDAVDQGRITPDERAQVLEADVVVAGLADGREVYLLAEVSGTITAHDVRRARERAAALEKATGRPVLPAVAGEQLSEDQETQEEAAAVWRVLDGRVWPALPSASS